MRRILTPVLALHWMLVFVLLAAALVVDGSAGVGEVFQLMGVLPAANGAPLIGGETTPLLFSVGFALVAALFLWTALDGAFGAERAAHERREVSMLAFAGAVIMLTAVLVYGFMFPVSGLMRAVMTSIAALLVSYVAIVAENRISLVRAPDERNSRAAIEAKAADAVHKLRLAHIAGRIDNIPSGGGA